LAEDSTPAVPPAATLKLKRAIKAHGEMIDILNFRAPTGADIIEVGDNPVVLDMSRNPPLITHNARAMAQMIARLAGINPGALRDMDPTDFTECCWLLTDFFMPASLTA
jgi:hypothetical protein